MPQFKFCFHLESKMSAAALAFSLPWSGPSSHCMRLRRNPPPHPSLLSLCLYLSYSLDDMNFLFLQKNPFFPTLFLSVIYHAFFYDLFQLEMVCIVWEVCVFAHLPSYWMLSDDCSRLSDVRMTPSLRTVVQHLIRIRIKHNMFPTCAKPDRSSHVGQADSNPPDAAKLLTSSQNFKKVCPALCHRSHQESGRCDQFKV